MSKFTQEEEASLLAMPEGDYITDYSIAYNIVQSAVDSHNNYWNVIKQCQEHIAGKKPRSQAELKKNGMSWVYNFNHGKAKAKLEKGTAENCSKISSALSLGYATFRQAVDDDSKDEALKFLNSDEQRGIASSAIGYALYHSLHTESRLSNWLNRVEYPAYSYGYCALMFDEFDWIPEPFHPLDIAFRPNTKPENINCWITFSKIEARELYRKWIKARNEVTVTREDGEKPQQIASSGWNLPGLEKILVKAYCGKLDGGKIPETWQEVIPSFQENPNVVISNTQDVSIAKIFYKELDGTLTEVYIPWGNPFQSAKREDDLTPNQASVNDTLEILYKKNKGKYIQEKVIGLIRDSAFTPGTGDIQELRGLAQFAVEDSIRYNRTRNGIGNKMQFIGSPFFKTDPGQSEKFKLTVSQGFVLMPSSHEMVDKQPVFDISSHLAVLSFEEKEYMRDTQQYDPTIQGRLTSRPNKGEVQRVSEEVQFTENSKNNIKFRDYSCIFKSAITRLPSLRLNEEDAGKDGKERFYNCIKKLVPWTKTDEDVNKLIKAIDSFVIEPVVSSVETITIAIQMAETPFARNRLKRMLLVAKGLPIEEVNIAVPLVSDKMGDMSNQRISMFENDMFFTTNEVLVSQGDDHIIHIESHTGKAQRVIDGVRQNAISPIEAFKYLENCIVHTVAHLDILGQDPILNKKAQEYFPIVKSIVGEKDKIKIAADKIMQEQQAQAQQVQLDPKTEAEIARDNAKAMADMQRKEWLTEKRTEQKERQMEMSHEQKMREIELKNGTSI